MSKKVSPAQIQMQYLDRIKKAAKYGDREMLAALYGQCEQLNIVVPIYKIDGEIIRPRHAIGRPAVERCEDGSFSIHMHESVEINGETKSLWDWCKEIGLSRGALRYRIISGQSLKEALTSPKVIYYTQRT